MQLAHSLWVRRNGHRLFRSQSIRGRVAKNTSSRSQSRNKSKKQTDMVHPVMEAARRKLVRKLVPPDNLEGQEEVEVEVTLAVASESKHQPCDGIRGSASEERAWQEMIRQYSNGLIKARHPRVLTLELQRKRRSTNPAGLRLGSVTIRKADFSDEAPDNLIQEILLLILPATSSLQSLAVRCPMKTTMMGF
ncbi:hypothetical protein PGTUg99_002974 [Puccinia graminis f. sp. tritici]|uniref:Uncharacterized protein n=1 Tax=Puccinia graminis f. sp. tritici TaxID=56615 RepID=A0A5B0QYC3_PUCGR|nr:hypothetical protein PGTUg99_002974 [Puccinia graminis f. sp. tritici]